MISIRRALLMAASVLTFIYLFRSTHSSQPPSIPNANAAKGQDPSRGGTAADSAVKGYTTAAANGGAPAWRGTTRSRLQNGAKNAESKQKTLTDIGNKSLKEQLTYQFPYDAEAKFPAYIWQTWKVTPASGEFDEKFRTGEASWTEKHPGFVHEVITDQVAVHLIRHLYAAVPSVLEAYKALPMAVMKADFFRYLILLARGGIYTDIDTLALRSAAEWVPETIDRSTYGLVIGIEADPDRPDWAQWYSRRIQFCQWTIQSKPGHPVLRDVVVAITEETLKRKATGQLKNNRELQREIVELTGPALWTDKIFDFFNSDDYFDMSTSKGNITWERFTGMTQAKRVGDVIVLPITSFSPGVKTMGSGEDDDPMAFVKHEFEGMFPSHSESSPRGVPLLTGHATGTWKPEEERHIGETDE